MDIMYLQQPGDTELSGGDTQDIRRPLIRPEAPKLRTQQSERWATTSQQQQQTHKQTQRTLYFYLFLSAGGQSQTRGASLLKIKLWNFDYHPAHSVIQHLRHTPPFINHMQFNNSLKDFKSRSTVSDSPRTCRCVKPQSTSWRGVRERRKIFHEQKSYQRKKKKIIF